MFKNTFSIQFILKLFNLLFHNCIIPLKWRTSIIKPIPKHSGLVIIDPLQYRGISLLSNHYKIYSCILNDLLTSYLEENEIFDDEQIGLRKGHSYAEHIFTLTAILRNCYINSDERVYLVYCMMQLNISMNIPNVSYMLTIVYWKIWYWNMHILYIFITFQAKTS